MVETRLNRNLGNYDMVLALSANKINHNFKLMYENGIIKDKWSFLANSTETKIKSLVNEEVEKHWKKLESDRDELEKIEGKLDKIDKDQEIADEKDDIDEIRKLIKEKKTLKENKKELQQKVNNAEKYDLALVANIAPPKIEISDNPKELLFKVEFQEGSEITYIKDNKPFKYPLKAKEDTKSIIYAFKVAIGKVRIDDTNKTIVEIDEKGKEKLTTLRDKGISPNDFTIESLFLDFENANIAVYDEVHSNLPKETRVNSYLQLAIIGYFKNLKNTDNPYILGYGISKKEVKQGEKAMLYPTGVAYSTSFSKKKDDKDNRDRSTFNFLMLLNHHDFPSSGDSGILPQSLLELAEDKTSTVNGVFGISVCEFENIFVNKLSQEIMLAVKKNLEEKGNKCKSESTPQEGDKNIKIEFTKTLQKEKYKTSYLQATLSIEYKGITANENNQEIFINYDVDLEGDLNITKEGHYADRYYYSWGFSTKEKFKEQTPKTGKLKITLEADKDGKLNLKPSNNNFSISYNNDPKHPTKTEQNKAAWDVIERRLSSPHSIEADAFNSLFNLLFDSVFNNKKEDMIDIQSLNELGEAVKIENLFNLENKVILPVASVYFYKNIRLMGTGDSAVILLDATYKDTITKSTENKKDIKDVKPTIDVQKKVEPTIEDQENLKPKIDNNISVKYHGELMENYFPESVIESGKGIKALMYKPDKAMVFFIDKDHRLNLIINLDDTESGWANYKLSSDGMEAIAFDIHHNQATNNLRVVYSSRNNNISELYVSNNIDLGKIDSKIFEDSVDWKKQELNNNSRIIDHISINSQGVLYSTSYKTSDAKYAYFRYEKESVDYTLPENAKQVIQLEVGQIKGQFGVFLLCEMKHGRTMLFQSFPDEEFGEVSDYDYKYYKLDRDKLDRDKQINAFSTLDDELGNSILYLAGNGLFRSENSDPLETISDAGQGINYSKIVTAANGDKVSIWTIGEKETKGLYYCTNRFHQSANQITKQWTTPLMMHNDVEEFACIKGDELLNQLFLFSNDGNSSCLIHFWQDQVTTQWYEFPVQIESLENTKKLETFTVNVQFSSDNLLRSFHEEKVKISAESNISVYVNERKATIGPNKSFETSIDYNQINIVYPTKSIAAPVLFLEADFIDDKYPIDPAHKLKEKLKDTFSNKEKLRNAKKQNGDSLISSNVNVSDEELEKVTSTTTNIFDYQEKTHPVSQSPTEGSIPFAPGAASMTLAASFEPTDTDIISQIGNGIGDIWHSIEKGFTELKDFVVKVVEDGVKFVIKIGEQIYEWISQKASDVWQFLKQVWEKIKVFFKDVFDYVGFLFKWDDILETKEVFKNALNNGFDALEKSMDGLKKKVTGIADQLQMMLDNPELTSQYEKMGKLSEYQKQANEIKEQQSEDYSADPRTNWISSKKGSLAKADIRGDLADDVNISEEDVSIFTRLEQAFKTVWEEVEGEFNALVNDEITVGDFLKVFVKKVAGIIVKVVEELVNAFLSLIKKLIRSAKDGLNAEINIPIFSTLYKKIDPKGNCSVIDVICLIIAIPFTAVFKGIAGKAPFEDTEFKDKFVNVPFEAFNYLLGDEEIKSPGGALTDYPVESRSLGGSIEEVQPSGGMLTDYSPEFELLGGSDEEMSYADEPLTDDYYVEYQLLDGSSGEVQPLGGMLTGSYSGYRLLDESSDEILDPVVMQSNSNGETEYKNKKKPKYKNKKKPNDGYWLLNESATAHLFLAVSRVLRCVTFPAKVLASHNKHKFASLITIADSTVRLFSVISLAATDNEFKGLEYSKVVVYSVFLGGHLCHWCGAAGGGEGGGGGGIGGGGRAFELADLNHVNPNAPVQPPVLLQPAPIQQQPNPIFDLPQPDVPENPPFINGNNPEVPQQGGNNNGSWYDTFKTIDSAVVGIAGVGGIVNLLSDGFSSEKRSLYPWQVWPSRIGVCTFQLGGFIQPFCKDPKSKLWVTGIRELGMGVSTGSEIWLAIRIANYNPILSVSLSHDGNLLAAVSGDKTIKLWDCNPRKMNSYEEDTDFVRKVSLFFDPRKKDKGFLWSVSLRRDGKMLAAGSEDNSIIIWNVDKKQIIKTLKGHRGSVWNVSFSPDGTMLASVSEDKNIKLWDVDDPNKITLIETLGGFDFPLRDLTFSPKSNNMLAAVGGDKLIKIWNIENKNQIQKITTLKEPTDSLWSVSFSPDGKMLAAGSEDNSIIIWQIKDNNTFSYLTTLEGHTGPVWSLSFSPSPDSKLLASASRDKTIKIWDVENVNDIKELKTLENHTDAVWSLSFNSNDGKMLASGSEDKSIIIWDIKDQNNGVAEFRNKLPDH